MSGGNNPETPDLGGLQQRVAAIAAQASKLTQGVATVTQNQADADRSWIARQIITVFVGTISGALLLLLIQGMMSGQWTLVGSQAAELIKTAVLPIVTLVLGYYFGQSNNKGG